MAYITQRNSTFYVIDYTLTAATRTRYRWMIDHNIAPRLGDLRLDALQPDDLDAFYAGLVTNGGTRH